MEPVVDTYHGKEVVDHYRWLEDLDSAETRVWIQEQNCATEAFLNAVPFRSRIEEELLSLWGYAVYTLPEKHGMRYFFQYDGGQQEYSIVLMQEGLQGKRTVLFDPSTLKDEVRKLRSVSFNEVELTRKNGD